MWVPQVPLPLAGGALLSQQYIVVPQVGGGARFRFAPGSSAQGIVAVGDVQAGTFEFDELAFGVEGAVFGGLASDADFCAQGIIGSFIFTTSDQAILFNLAAFRESVAAQVVVVLGVVFLDQLALAIPLVAGVAGQAVLGGFQAVFGVPAVASCRALLALPFAFDQAAVAVV